MLVLERKEDCCGCTACERICPNNCIVMKPDEEGFLYPEIDASTCIDCGACDRVCPMINHTPPINLNPAVYACKNKDEQTRVNSSSGGIFTLLSKEIIKKGGVVFGATFDDKFNVYHKHIDTENKIIDFRGSKYVQSSLKTTYTQVEDFLKSDRLVLFSGTPCQIYGLSCYLRKNYDNLILVQTVCMGVPSPLVFNKYKEYLQNEYDGKIKNINFRDKVTGWKNYSITVDFDNDKVYTQSHSTDHFLHGFSKLLYLRPACHECPFKNFVTRADITLGDYWGVHTRFPNIDDNKGVSMILVHTKKASQLLQSIEDNVLFEKSDITHAIKTHNTMMNSVPRSKNRKAFFAGLEVMSIDTLIKEYTKPTLYERTRKMGGIVLRKMGLRK